MLTTGVPVDEGNPVLNSNLEMWRDVVGYEGYYEVSDHGRVRNTRSGKVLSEQTQSDGKYKFYHLWRKNKGKGHRAHRLVACAFIPNPENKPQVNHIDADTANNHVSNLEWVTVSENHKHAYARKGSVKNPNTVLGKKLGGNADHHSRHRHVFWDKSRNKWAAQMKVDQKTHNIGRFDDEDAAAKAVNQYILDNGLLRKGRRLNEV